MKMSIIYIREIIYMPNVWNAHCGFNYERKFNELGALNNNKFTFGLSTHL